MKKIILSLVVIASMMMTSCTTLYVQTVNIKSADTNSTSAYKYSDGNVTISYDFWTQNGNPGFLITNNSDELIYVDLTKSFFVAGADAKDYYLNRTFTSSSSFTESVSASQTSKAFGKWYPSGLFGTLAVGVSNSAAKKTSSGISYEEKPVIAIPAHTHKYISEYNLLSSPLQDCSVKMFPGSAGSTYRYSDDDMPEFSNVITYRVGDKGEDVVVTNKFKITGFTNMKEKKARVKTKVGCKETGKVISYKTANPMSFYIIYNNNTSNRYSSDAKEESK